MHLLKFKLKNILNNELFNMLKKQSVKLLIQTDEKTHDVEIHTNFPITILSIISTYSQVIDFEVLQPIITKEKIAILTDTIADIPNDLCNIENLYYINLTYTIFDDVYVDKISHTGPEVLEISSRKNVFPKSSQPSPMLASLIVKFLEKTYKSAIIYTVSKKLSGTYSVLYTESSKSSIQIDVVDTTQNSVAQGLIVLEAAQMAAKNLSHDDILKKSNKHITNSKIHSIISDIINLTRSGRISLTKGKIAQLVSLKPIITLEEGKTKIGAISFTFKGAFVKLTKILQTILKTKKVIKYAITHVSNLEYATKLADKLTKLLGFKPSYVVDTGSIIAFSVGDKAIALAYIFE